MSWEPPDVDGRILDELVAINESIHIFKVQTTEILEKLVQLQKEMIDHDKRIINYLSQPIYQRPNDVIPDPIFVQRD